ncbi:MAG: alpha-amylase family glycosyl hydrolase [Anaerolineales bacterium]|nr:alpha-amylase family glycosyl hydrolase [Anaerolineales bacterium]
MDDFIFGSLGDDAKRLAHERARRGGVTHAQQRRPRDPLPGQAVVLELTVGPAYPHDRAWVYWTNDGSDPAGEGGRAVNGHVTELEPVEVEWDTLLWGYRRRFRGVLPGQPAGAVVRYRLSAGGCGSETPADGGAVYGFYVDDDPAPAWAQDVILYQIFPDRFYSPANDFPRVEPKPSLKCNGNLRGITAKLDYLAELGINCLWLNPIFPSPSYHGYDATSLFEIEPRLGTPADFRELIDQAHARGIRVLLDFVPNHWSNRHATFQAAVKDRHSPYVPWYTFRRWPDDYATFFGVKDLPQINLRHGPARAHVLDAAKYWLDFGVDGYRVDYCIGPTPDFYADFRRVTRAANPDCWTFGEAVDPPDSQLTFEGGLDGALDFLLLEALRQAFAYGTWDAARLAAFLDRHEAYYPPTFSRPSFLDNHDMNRFLWSARGDVRRLKLAALCQFTLAGPPIIYYGTEVGLSQKRDVRQGGRALHEEARLPMRWGADRDTDLLAFYRDLCAARHASSALRRGSRRTLLADGSLFAYRRADASDARVTVLNLGAAPAEATLAVAESAPILATDPACRVRAVADGLIHVSLPPLAGVLLAQPV